MRKQIIILKQGETMQNPADKYLTIRGPAKVTVKNQVDILGIDRGIIVTVNRPQEK